MSQPQYTAQMHVWTEWSFDAAHFLPGVPEGHKCRRMHGHTYRLRVAAAGPLSADTGFVVDYADLKAIVDPLVAKLDHHTLNDFFDVPTCEALAAWLWSQIAPRLPAGVRLSEVTLRETERSGVTLRDA